MEVLCARGEMDIITGFEPVVGSSNLSGGTVKFKKFMKKLFIVFFVSLMFLLLCSTTAKAAPLVPCGNTIDPTGAGACQLSDLFVLARNIYTFIVLTIATPLATLLMVIGGVIWVVSAGNPSQLDMGKRMFKGATWGLVLIFGSWVIINVVLITLGYTVNWSQITF